MEIRITANENGKTVRELMRGVLGFSAAHLRHLKFLEQGILVNGARVTVRYVLREGDLLTLAAEDLDTPEKLLPVDLPLAIAYEDDDLVIPNKSADMPTHPSCGHYEDTVANALAFRYAEQGIPFVFRPISRLDRNTSGLLTVARNRIAAARLTRAMQAGTIRKRYVAILCGVPASDGGIIETYQRRTAESVILRENCLPDEGGDLARTHYRVLCRSEDYSLVYAEPLTGRTHQLRVHFAGLGCPILGDDLYGVPSDDIGRHALHSCMLSLPLPSTGRRISVWADLPDDMRDFAVKAFGEDVLTRAMRTCLETAFEDFKNQSGEVVLK